jgi:Type II secretion system (T2SS), protein E, N-terminal domain
VPSIIDLLVKIQILDERQHDAVESRARSPAGGHIVQQVAEMGYATEGTVARAVSVELGLPRIDLAMTPPEPAALALLDPRTCADRFVLPVALRDNGELLWLAMADPTDQEAIGVVARKTQKRVRPAVAGPTEILRTIRSAYAAPATGSSGPEPVQNEKLAAIEIDSAEEETPFEVLNVADDIQGDTAPQDVSAISKIARQLGVDVPPNIPSRGHMDALEEVPEESEAAAPFTLQDLFAPLTRPGPISRDDLSGEDISTLEALRVSMEKGALVLRSLAELCVEKGVITREEMKKRRPPTDPVKPS